MEYSLSHCRDKQSWDSFVRDSPQGNIFCLSAFLDAADPAYELLLLTQRGTPLLGAVLPLQDGRPAPAPPLTMYQGVMFSSAVISLPTHSRVHQTLKLLDYFLSQMELRYDRLSFSLHYHFPDLRGFNWFHYHQPESGQFTIDIHYTGLLPLAEVTQFAEYLNTIRDSRRQEYRKAHLGGWSVERANDLELLDHLHQLTFERQGVKRSAEEVHALRSIARAALDKDFGMMWICRNQAGAVGAANLFLHDDRCGYYLLGANDPSYRQTGCSTFLLLESIRHCNLRGLTTVDFVGVNSPNRGDYKTSYNAVPTPYAAVNWRRPEAVPQQAGAA